MSYKRIIREDEKNIDFGNTRDTFIESWNTSVELYQLRPSDLKVVGHVVNLQAFSEYIRAEQEAARQKYPWRRSFLDGIAQFHRHLAEFENTLSELLEQGSDDGDFTDLQPIDTSAIWALIYLNVKLTLESKTKVKLNSKWMLDLRRNVELLNGVVGQCREHNLSDDNNLRMQIMEVFDPLLESLRDSIDYLQSHYEDDDFRKGWTAFESTIKENIDGLFQTIRHLREVMATSRSSIATKLAVDTGNVRLRNPASSAEKDIFPLELLPPAKTEHFVGRKQDLGRIHSVLGTENDNTLKTFTIYGRRGVGKTQLALEYARSHKSTYDAIFWVQCETRAALRSSYTAIAEALELEGTSQNINSFDENTMRVLRWLRHTEKRWLLIYDNAEREQAEQLHQYLPTATKGAMLLTSRSYYNFFDDAKRQGETVLPFTEEESKELLLKHLGDDWQAYHLSREDFMYQMEEKAIEILIAKTKGLPIAIYQAAKLILDKDIGGSQTARGFIEKFNLSLKELPKRQLGRRDDFITALDAIWAIAFERLSPNARTVLSILAFMSPDSILLDLFLPSDQSRLTDILAFCRSASSDMVVQVRSIETIVKPSAELNLALDELTRRGLINKVGRQLSLHRTVREGLAYANSGWYRDCFAAGVNLLYDAFPQQSDGRPLSDSWNWCRVWIPHAVQLANQYALLSKRRGDDEPPLVDLKSADALGSLLANCAWYLFEIADYEECLHIIAIARSALPDRNTTTYAHLLNTEGSIYNEQNRLGLARRALEEALAIREELLEPGHLELANVYNNLCNVESAEGNVDAAIQYISKAIAIHEAIGDSAAVLLALSSIVHGRCYFLKGDFTQAYRVYQRAEALLNKKVARNPYFLASLFYAYGNLSFAQREYEAAAREYEKARQIMRPLNPVHPLVAACQYKIACTEFERDHHTKALNFLNKAYDIADVKSGGRVNGTILRILWKRSEVLQDYNLASANEGASSAENCAIQQKVIADDLGIDLGDFVMDEDPERAYDMLVPGYFR